MRALTYLVASTIDGRISGPANDAPDFFLQEGLHPVMAGSGIGLFDGGFSPERFRLTEVEPFGSGVVHLTYTRR
ncbi:hypothetical protein GCM10009854_13620 [Saccharopolyspora halophila]|uniref:Bacterial bifunctional deaminase-reductase C-terminal domain-containing protein n=1 Tax=Saccharopolyspora halophila TaxID=405551 RepID=A0ABN3FVL5_9PSEU